jgi:hypothetical protein
MLLLEAMYDLAIGATIAEKENAPVNKRHQCHAS